MGNNNTERLSEEILPDSRKSRMQNTFLVIVNVGKKIENRENDA